MTKPSDESLPMHEQVVDFVYREAQLIDTKAFDEWYELFTEDAIYWMPLARNQAEEDQYNALFFEDKMLLKVRIERLKHPRAFSQQTPSYCQHVLQAPQLRFSDGAQLFECATPFVYVESQADDQFVLAGVAHHRLCVVGGELEIQRKRIELINREAALPSIQLFI